MVRMDERLPRDFPGPELCGLRAGVNIWVPKCTLVLGVLLAGGGLYCYAYVVAQNAQIGHVM